MSWRIVSVSSSAKLDYKSDYLVVRTVDSTKRIHLSEIAVLILESTAISLTAYLLCELAKRKIDVILCDEKRLPVGSFLPLYGSHDTSLKFRKQVSWGQGSKDLIWAEIVRAKIYGQSVVSEKNEILDFSKCAEVIPNVIGLSFESRSMTNKINQEINQEGMILSEDSGKLLADINMLASRILMRLDFDAKFTELNDLSAVLKLLNFAVNVDDMSPLEQLEEYMNLYASYFKRKLFILVNFKDYFSEEEQKAFLKYLQYKKLNVLLLERHCHEKISDDEVLRIIDKDLCEI